MKPKILIIEDDLATTKLLQFILESEGFHTEVAYSGMEGLEKMSTFGAQLVLLDVMMPGMDGFEVCRKLKEDPGTVKLPIVFLSAKALSEDVEKGLSMGADDYITKPFVPQELVSRLRKVLQRYPQDQGTAPSPSEQDWDDSLKIISLGMNSFIKWDLVKFLFEHPERFFFLSELAESLRRNPDHLQRALNSLLTAGICQEKSENSGEYQFTADQKMRQRMEDFFRYCKTEQGRIKAVCEILKYETGLAK